MTDRPREALANDERRSLREPWLAFGSGKVLYREQLWLLGSVAGGTLILVLFGVALLTIRRMRHQIEAGHVAERDLQVSELRLRTAMKGSETGLWEWKPHTGEVYLDPVWYTMLGYAPDAMPAAMETFEALLHPDDRAAALELNSAAIAAGQERFEADFRMRCADGTYRWIRSKGRLLEVDTDGYPGRLVGIHTDITEQISAQEALRESQQKLLKAQETAHIGNWEWVTQDNRITWSDEIYRIYGIDRTTPLTYEVLMQAIHPEDRQYHEEHTAGWLKNRGGEPYEYRIIRPDGDIRFICGDGEVTCDESGEPVGFIGILQDVTESKQREQALQENEKRFRATFEQAAVGIAHVAPDGQFLRVNNKLCDVLGYSHDQMRDLGFQAITHADDLESDLDQVQRLLGGQTDTYSMEKRYLHQRGHIVWANLTVSLVRDEAGQPAFFVSVIEEISDRKQAETLLRQREAERDELLERLQQIAANVPGFIYQYRQRPNGESHLQYVSGDIEAVYGVSAEQAATDAAALFDAIHPDDIAHITASIAESAAGMTEWHQEYRVVHPSGRLTWVEARATPEKMKDGSLVWYGYHSDISARRQQEKRLQEYQQRLKSLAGQLTLAEERERRHIAADLHDHVGQSLALTRLQLAAARKGLPSESPLTAQLGDISQSLLKAIQDTRHLIFELSSPALNELGLGAAIAEWTEKQAGSRHGLRAEVLDHTERLAIELDLRAILFRNTRELITNVVKHAQAHNISISLEQGAGELVVTVQDDGVGFDPDVARQGVNTEGGFGLFSIQERMTALGGRLELVSSPGAGCRAKLRLPVKGRNPELRA